MILMASSTGADGPPAARGSGVGSFGSFRVACNLITCCVKRLRFSKKSGVHLLPHTIHLLRQK